MVLFGLLECHLGFSALYSGIKSVHIANVYNVLYYIEKYNIFIRQE